MTKLTTGPEVIEMRDNLAGFIIDLMISDSRIVLSHDTERVHFDFADDLIRAGWVTEVPE